LRIRRRTPIATEIELKLAAPTSDLPLLEAALRRSAPGACGAAAVLTSTYFDTPDRALRRAGIVLRVRRERGRFVQTVKAAGAGDGGLLARGEWEDVVAGDQPDRDAPRSGEHLPADAFAALRPLFVTDVTRTVVELHPSPGTCVEAAIDRGEIRLHPDGRSEPISEVELELKSGDPAALYDIALELAETAAVRIETPSKSERGYRLADGGAGVAVVHAEPVSLDPAVTIDAALRRIGGACLAHLLRNEAAALAGEPEGVHQMRVAVRTLRSALSSFKRIVPRDDRRRVSDELAWIAGPLGAARNLDVLATQLMKLATSELAEEGGRPELAAIVERARAAARERVREHILSPQYTTAVLRLLRWFEGREVADAAPIGWIAPRLLDRRRRKVRQRSKGFRRMGAGRRHELRIAVKKLRYATELLGSLFDPEGLRKYVKRLKRLQDDLGYANDVRVARGLLTDLLGEGDPPGPAAQAGTRLIDWHQAVLDKRERKLRRHLRRLNRAHPFWRE
jgi:inorganic triphosphatase YgiF